MTCRKKLTDLLTNDAAYKTFAPKVRAGLEASFRFLPTSSRPSGMPARNVIQESL
jgi:hypothetical protein